MSKGALFESKSPHGGYERGHVFAGFFQVHVIESSGAVELRE